MAKHGNLFLSDYNFNPDTGLWKHKNGPVEPPMSLNAISYNSAGEMQYPIKHDRTPESSLKNYIKQAQKFSIDKEQNTATNLSTNVADLLGEQFESMRWFELPHECLDEVLPKVK